MNSVLRKYDLTSVLVLTVLNSLYNGFPMQILESIENISTHCRIFVLSRQENDNLASISTLL